MEAFQSWRRRWVLTTCLLLLALLGTGFAVFKVPRTYQADSTVVLLASHDASKSTGGGNPYLSFSDSLSTTASVISSELMDSQTALSLKARGFPNSYEVVSQSTLSNSSLLPAPFLLVTVTGSNKVSVERTLHGVTSQISVALGRLQSGISPNNRISLIIASFAPQANLNIASTARPLVVVLAMLLIVAFGVPLTVDARSARKKRTGSGEAWPSAGGSQKTAIPVGPSGEERHRFSPVGQPRSADADNRQEHYNRNQERRARR